MLGRERLGWVDHMVTIQAARGTSPAGWDAQAPTDRYTRVAIILHWTIAALIVFNLSVGFFMEGFPLPLKLLVVGLHVSSGMTVLALTIVRVVWRLLHEPPEHPAGTRRWERNTAHFAHFLLYAAMVLMPLTGWAIVSSHPAPGTPGAIEFARQHPRPAMPAATKPPATPGAAAGSPKGGMKIWFVIPMPSITVLQRVGEQPEGVKAQGELHETFVGWHSLGGYLLLALLLLHVAGALKHQILDRQAELARMGVGWRWRR